MFIFCPVGIGLVPAWYSPVIIFSKSFIDLTNKNLLKFSEDNCEALYLERKNPLKQHRLWTAGWGTAPVKET